MSHYENKLQDSFTHEKLPLIEAEPSCLSNEKIFFLIGIFSLVGLDRIDQRAGHTVRNTHLASIDS